MTDRLTPAHEAQILRMFGKIFDEASRNLEGPAFGAVSVLRALSNHEAARREAEEPPGPRVGPSKEGAGVPRFPFPKHRDAPPPPAPDYDALRHKLLALRGNMRGAEFDNPNVGLVLRDAADAIEALRARAEAAEAEATRMRTALLICIARIENPATSPDANWVLERARAALAQGESK